MAVITVTRDNFEEEVIRSEKPVVIDFNAGWCGPCRALKPIVEELSEECSDIKFVSIDIDEEDEIAEDYDVTSIPCLVMVKGGEETVRSIGLKSKDALVEIFGGK